MLEYSGGNPASEKVEGLLCFLQGTLEAGSDLNQQFFGKDLPFYQSKALFLV